MAKTHRFNYKWTPRKLVRFLTYNLQERSCQTRPVKSGEFRVVVVIRSVWCVAREPSLYTFRVAGWFVCFFGTFANSSHVCGNQTPPLYVCRKPALFTSELKRRLLHISITLLKVKVGLDAYRRWDDRDQRGAPFRWSVSRLHQTDGREHWGWAGGWVSLHASRGRVLPPQRGDAGKQPDTRHQTSTSPALSVELAYRHVMLRGHALYFRQRWRKWLDMNFPHFHLRTAPSLWDMPRDGNWL